MKINLIYTLEKVTNEHPSIFLAGPSLRPDQFNLAELSRWRNNFVSILAESDLPFLKEVNIIIPEYRDEKQPSDWTYSRQVSWEMEQMKKATIIGFWIQRTTETPGFTTNIEFGEYMNSGKIVVGFPENTLKNEYIEERLNQMKIKICRSMNTFVFDCVFMVSLKMKQAKAPSIFFTSDTHFGEERSMKLSNRPFKSVDEMNWEIIKQWNMKISNNDIVYHLGDFGDYNYLKFLNFKQLNLIVGNYDKNYERIKELYPDREINIIDKETHKISLSDKESVTLTHYPSLTKESDEFYLFGHIHGLRMVKKNALNVGVDAHYFKPLSLDEVNFYKNAILNHYDNEVFGG